jgi:eukaryotic-like serine/threonine-protein kinase
LERTVPNGNPPPRRPVELTQDYQPSVATSQPADRCRMALVQGTGPCANTEMLALLRHRLRLAALIMASGFAVFLVRSLFDADNPYVTVTGRVVQAVVTLAMAGVAALLWSRRPLCVGPLRCLEIGVFGLAAAFFTWLQGEQLTGELTQRVAHTEGDGQVLRVMLSALACRWLVLIVLYGTFIPTTWRRCALMVGALMAVPLVHFAVVGWTTEALRPYVWVGLLDMSLLLGFGAAIAIFGSYKISTLQEEAFEARKLGQYRLKKRLGAGGMGEVYLAEHVLLRRPCAIKLIRPDQAGDATNLRRFEREVRETAKLTHWNTVEIFDYGRTADGTFYYVMEYLPGLSLQELVDQYGPLRPERAVHLLRQVCQGLREAHAIGLIHRDIKPSNILACERGGVPDVAKLVDFGLVRSSSPLGNEAKLTQEGVVAGSPLYLSPEQARGWANLDARGDIYSLGAVAFFLLTGEPPFDRESPMEALMAHVYEQIRFPPEYDGAIPADLKAIVLQCLEKEPERRFQSVVALERALAQCRCAGLWTEERAAAWWREHDQARAAAADAAPQEAAKALVATDA